MTLRATALAALLAVSSLSMAEAAALTWTFSGQMNDGTSATGSFDYDSSTDTYSAISFVTAASGSFGTNTFTVLKPDPSVTLNLVPAGTDPNGDLTGLPNLFLSFAALPATGGTVSIDIGGPGLGLRSGESFCSNATCNDISGASRVFTSGTLTTNPVPEPATLALLGAGLLGLGALRRHR